MGDEEENRPTGIFNIGSAVIVPTFSRGNKVRMTGKPTHWHPSVPLQSKAVDSTCSEDKRPKVASQQLSVDQASHQFKSRVKTFVMSRWNISLASGE
jgi:hypothetical protein